MAPVLLAVAGCAPGPSGVTAPGPSPGPPRAGRVAVIASFYPLYEFAVRVGGEHVSVRNLVPPGASAHDYEPTAGDVAALNKARVLLYNGAGFEPWVEKLLPTLPGSVERVNTTAGFPLLERPHDREVEPQAKTGGRKDGPQAEGLDPHVWVDPVLAQRQVDHIVEALVKVDPAHRAAYEANAAALKADLRALHERIAGRVNACRQKTIVTAHAAFSHFSKRYGLRMISISGLSPEIEPSPARLRQVLREVRQYRVTVIYFETITSPKVAQTIAQEVGARTLVLDPVEGLTSEQQAAGATYFTVMDENLRNLAEGLDCR